MTTQPVGSTPALQIGFGDRMRRLRLNLGMSQDEFASALDISGATVGKYEVQGRTPRMGKVIASLVQLRFGKQYPGLDLRYWLLTGQSRQPTDYGVRHLRAVA